MLVVLRGLGQRRPILIRVAAVAVAAAVLGAAGTGGWLGLDQMLGLGANERADVVLAAELEDEPGAIDPDDDDADDLDDEADDLDDEADDDEADDDDADDPDDEEDDD